jgi:hypothetical protein
MRALAIALAVLSTVGGLPLARASGQSGSGSGSGGDSASSKDSNSSNGSNESSNSSKGTSDDSRASSKSSDNSTQNSPKNSSDYTTRHSSDWTTHSRDGHVFSVVMLVVSVGATVVGVLVAKGSGRQSQQQAATALADTMRRQHPLLTHDVATARGPVLDAWAHDLRLTDAERRRLIQALEGSAEQGQLLEALDGRIDEGHARRFGAAFLRLTQRAVGPARTRGIVERALREVGPG